MSGRDTDRSCLFSYLKFTPKMASLGVLTGFFNLVSCLFVYLYVYSKTSFLILSLRALPDLLRPKDSLIYPNGVYTVGNNALPL